MRTLVNGQSTAMSFPNCKLAMNTDVYKRAYLKERIWNPTFLARCLKSSVFVMRPALQSGFRYGLRYCTITPAMCRRNWSLIFLAASLDVSAATVTGFSDDLLLERCLLSRCLFFERSDRSRDRDCSFFRRSFSFISLYFFISCLSSSLRGYNRITKISTAQTI